MGLFALHLCSLFINLMSPPLLQQKHILLKVCIFPIYKFGALYCVLHSGLKYYHCLILHTFLKSISVPTILLFGCCLYIKSLFMHQLLILAILLFNKISSKHYCCLPNKIRRQAKSIFTFKTLVSHSLLQYDEYDAEA